MKTLIKNATIVNEGKTFIGAVLINNGNIEKVLEGSVSDDIEYETLIDATGLHLLPGLIDDQVHFREPGLTHKGDIYTESRAAVAGGVTSYMEMPNTNPQTLTQELLEEKYKIASERSLANYSFFMGVSNHNLEEALKTDPANVCGLKIFMGSSTGDMLVDDADVLNKIFAETKMLIAVHCEDEASIRKNTEIYKEKYGENIPVSAHALIRNAEACYKSSSLAIELAKKHNTRLHILHISSAIETDLFRNDIPLSEKRITAEACIHHLWFTDKDYATKGKLIKWNPAVKTNEDRDAVWKALLDGRIDVIATDHAPHTLAEKENKYLQCPSGGPLVQHSLQALLEFYHQGKITLEQIVQKAVHNLAIMFQIKKRGYIREGYAADLALVNLNKPYTVRKENILYKCGWSPFEGYTFKSSIEKVFVNGHLAFDNGELNETKKGERLLFNRS